MREQPEQQAPPVQRLRIRYAKRGRLRFTSHRDFSRAFERAVARARLPMAYSSGFHPHPRISYAGAAPTGAASEAEYLEIGLAQVVDPADVAAALAEALPDGLDVVTVVESPGGSLADRLTASRWTVQVPGVAGPGRPRCGLPRRRRGDRGADDEEGPAQLRLPRGRRLAAADTRRGRRRADAELDLVLRHTVPAVRPDDVLAGLALVAGEDPAAGDAPVPLLTRLQQGPLDETTGEIGDPLVASA